MLRGLAVLFGVVGVLALVDGVLTLVWQEPISGLLAHISQGQLAKSLDALDHQRPTAADEAALNGLPTDQQRMAYFARNLEQTAQPAQAVGRIVIPRIGANYVVVAGTSAASLRKGPGIYSGTSVPGLPGTVGIAGHRTTYLAPFRRINELSKGDLITVQMPYGSFTYTVTGHKIVAPNNIDVLRPTGYDQVVLTACNPLYSASQRLAVFARLTSSVPTGLALSTSVPQTPAASTPAAATPVRTIPATRFAGSLLGAAQPVEDGPLAAVGAAATGSRADGLVVRVPAVRVQAPARKSVSPTRTTSSGSSGSAVSPIAPVVQSRPVVPAAPVKVVARAPTKPAASSPSVSKPDTSSPQSPTTSAPTTSTSTSQTRVQGAPGGPAPIIGQSD
jgi:sortase A